MMEDRAIPWLIFTTLLWIQCQYVVSNTTIVSMDKTNSSECGKVVVLGPSHEVRLLSNGLAPNGYCGVSVFTPREIDGYTCDAICVTYKKASISTCEVKVKMIGHKFRKAGDLVKEYNCHDQKKDAFCMEVGSLRVEVIESYNYAYVSQKPLYEFDLDVSARCTKDSVRHETAEYIASKADTEEDEHQTYVEGITVGVSLACVFLIVLFVAWCYTKHQAVAGGRSPSSNTTRTQSDNTHKKGSIISTFRKKLRIRRKSAQSSDEPEAVYRKTTDTSGEAKASPNDSDATVPLTKESDHETFELANETLAEGGKEEIPNEKPVDVEDSPKDGGAEGSKLEPPEVVVVPGTPEPAEGQSDS